MWASSILWFFVATFVMRSSGMDQKCHKMTKNHFLPTLSHDHKMCDLQARILHLTNKLTNLALKESTTAFHRHFRYSATEVDRIDLPPKECRYLMMHQTISFFLVELETRKRVSNLFSCNVETRKKYLHQGKYLPFLWQKKVFMRQEHDVTEIVETMCPRYMDLGPNEIWVYSWR